MPPPLLIDLAAVDLSRVALPKDRIYSLLPHRHEFQLLDGICSYDLEKKWIIGFIDIRPTDWWVRGHVEGRPLLPGVLMLEAGAQSSAVLAKLVGIEGFLGFGGVTECKFREPIVPPAKLFVLCVGVDYRSRRIVSDIQGVVGGRVAFEAQITGLVLR